jgi:hypothetical protein
MSSFTLLPVVKQESLPLMFLTSLIGLTSRQVAGVMMLGIGIWYLGFGAAWISWYRGGEDKSRPSDSTTHLITGVQVSPL